MTTKRLTQEEWEQVRKSFVKGESLSKLAECFGVSRQALSKKKGQEKKLYNKTDGKEGSDWELEKNQFKHSIKEERKRILSEKAQKRLVDKNKNGNNKPQPDKDAEFLGVQSAVIDNKIIEQVDRILDAMEKQKLEKSYDLQNNAKTLHFLMGVTEKIYSGEEDKTSKMLSGLLDKISGV